MNGSKLSKLVRTEPVRKELDGNTKESQTEERKEPYDAPERREQKKRNLQRDKKTKQLKPTFASKTALYKALQNKTKTNK